METKKEKVKQPKKQRLVPGNVIAFSHDNSENGTRGIFVQIIKILSENAQLSKKSAERAKKSKNTGRPSPKNKRNLLTEKLAQQSVLQVRHSQRILQKKQSQMDQQEDSNSEESSLSSHNDD